MRRKIIQTLCCTVGILSALFLPACTAKKSEPQVSAPTVTKTVVNETTGQEKEISYESLPVSDTRAMSYNEKKKLTTITDGEVSFNLLDAWTDQGRVFVSDKYGTVNLINYGELISVSDFINDASTSTGWNIKNKKITIVFTALSEGVVCYNFQVAGENSTYQFFYTSNRDTSYEDAAKLVASVLNSFNFSEPKK